MRVSPIVFALLCLFAAPMAFAGAPAVPDTNDKVTLDIDPMLRRREAAYQEAVKPLSPAQQATLRALEGDYMKISGAAINMMGLSAQLDFCNGKEGSGIAKNPSRYFSGLGVMREQQQAAEAAERARLDEAEASKINFVDKTLLDSHLAFVTQLTEGIGRGVVEETRKNGGFDRTDCEQTAAKIDAGFGKTGAAKAPDPARLAGIKNAADAGSADAMTTMAMMEITGEGFPQDFEKGKALLTTAAEQGDDRAQYMLGLVLASDVFGGTMDIEKAKYWLQKAAGQGNKKAAAMIAQIDAAKPVEPLDNARKNAGESDGRH